MNVPNNNDDVLRAWERLFERIEARLFERIEARRYSYCLRLDDHSEKEFDLTNAELMSRMRERLVDTLRVRFSSLRDRFSSLEHPNITIHLGNKFFSTMSEHAQRSFFDAICTLPLKQIHLGNYPNGLGDKLEITIVTPAMLDAISSMSGLLQVLDLSNFSLKSTVQAQQLAHIIANNKETLTWVRITHIECPMYYNKRDCDGHQIGFLDPILDALFLVRNKEIGAMTEVSARTPSLSCCLVSPKSFSLLLSNVQYAETMVYQYVGLNSLGLNNEHCFAIAERVCEHRAKLFVTTVNLKMNPRITDDGYNALLKAVNHTEHFPEICVDDKCWQEEINFAKKLNDRYGRLDYLEDGVFPSRECWVEWLEKVATIQETSDRLSCIYYTLRENPAFLMS